MKPRMPFFLKLSLQNTMSPFNQIQVASVPIIPYSRVTNAIANHDNSNHTHNHHNYSALHNFEEIYVKLMTCNQFLDHLELSIKNIHFNS